MPRVITEVSSGEAIGIVSLGLAVFVGGWYLFRRFRSRVPSPEEVEAQRRAWLAHHGKLGGGEVVEVDDHRISYVYDIRGLTYMASQEITALAAQLPADRYSILGAVGVRYDPKNPANSIVLSETWTGLRQAKPQNQP